MFRKVLWGLGFAPLALMLAISLELTAQNVAFVSERSGNQEIYVSDFNGSGPINASNNPASDDDPRWSPDGSRILFVSDRSGQQQPYVMNADGTAQTRLPVEGDLCSTRWSTDGAKILLSTAAVAEAGKAYTANPDGSKLTQVATVAGCPQWSPDGTKVLYMAGDFWQGNLVVFDTVRQSVAWSAPGLGDFAALDPQWSPDGSQVIVPTDSGPGVVNGLKLVAFDAVSGTSTVISHGGAGTLTSVGVPWAWDEQVKWSPDGGKILVQSRDGSSFYNQAYVYAMNSDGSGRVNLTTSQAALQYLEFERALWSPDGSKLLFESQRSGTSGIYVANTDGSGLIKLSGSSYSEGDSDAVWSPDGSRIFFSSYLEGFPASLNVAKPDGSGVEEITNRFGPGHDFQFFGDFGTDPTPEITQGGVVMANLIPRVEAISPLSIVSIFGSQFSAGSVFYPSLDQTGRITTNLGGTCVEIGGQRAPILAMTPGQANVQMPSTPSYGPASVVVVHNCGKADEVRSQPATVLVEETTPVFWVDSYENDGYIRARFNDGFAPVTPTVSLADPKGPSRPARPGEIILLFGTGWGPTTAGLEAGELAAAAAPLLPSASPMVMFGGIPLAAQDVLYAGAAPGAAGQYQLAIRVPANAAHGKNTVVLTVFGKSTPAGPAIPVDAQ